MRRLGNAGLSNYRRINGRFWPKPDISLDLPLSLTGLDEEFAGTLIAISRAQADASVSASIPEWVRAWLAG